MSLRLLFLPMTLLAATITQFGCSAGGDAAPGRPVDAARLTAADAEPTQWMSHGRTYDEQRFSPLDQIKAENIKELGLTWYADLDTNRGQEATPLVIDGVMYVTSAWSKLFALDARTGKELWTFTLPAAAQATPITYRGADGRQYVVITSTGGGFFGNPVTDDSVMAFALPRR